MSILTIFDMRGGNQMNRITSWLRTDAAASSTRTRANVLYLHAGPADLH